MGFEDAWLQEDANEIIQTVLEASRASNPLLKDITFERLQEEGAIPLQSDREEDVPFANGYFPTPSGKVEIYSEQARARGYDPLPGWVPEVEQYTGLNEHTGRADEKLPLLCPAAHHFISSTFGNQARMREKERHPTLYIHPRDAAIRGIRNGGMVRVSNERGWCRLVAQVNSDDVRPGVLATTTVWWPEHSPDQRGINWLTSDRLADFNGGSTFYTNLVMVEPDDEIRN
jgi:anaerobic selenocysteine-containing dehydrogenase